MFLDQTVYLNSGSADSFLWVRLCRVGQKFFDGGLESFSQLGPSLGHFACLANLAAGPEAEGMFRANGHRFSMFSISLDRQSWASAQVPTQTNSWHRSHLATSV